MPPVIGVIVAIGQIIGAGVAAGGIVGAVFTAGLTYGASALVNLIVPHPSIMHDSATSQLSVRQPISNYRVIYGETQLGGPITFMGLNGTNNEYLNVVITIACHKVNEINSLWIDGVLVPLAINAGGATDGRLHPTEGNKYYQHMMVEYHDGDPDDTSQPFPQLHADMATYWTNNHLQRGHAKAHIRFKWDDKVYQSGMPTNIAFRVKGKEVYNPASDTIAWSENPALCFRDLLTDQETGFGVPDSDIDDDNIIAQMTICNEVVNLKAGGSINRYTCNGAFDTGVNKGDILKAICASMAGAYVEPGDLWRCFAGAYREPTIILTDDHLCGPIQMTVMQSRRDIANAVKGTYISGANQFQPSDFPPFVDVDLVAEDGGVVLFQDIELGFTNVAPMAQRIAKIQLQRLRRQKQFTASYKLFAYQCTPGDVIEVTHERFGLDQATFEVASTELVCENEDDAPKIYVKLVLQETDSEVYAWDETVDEGDLPEPLALLLPDLGTTQPPTDLALQSDSSTNITRVDGIVQTRILATWTSPAEETVTAGGQIEIWLKKHSDSIFNRVGVVTGSETSFFISNIEDNTSYDVQLVALNTVGVPSDPTATVTITSSSTKSDFGGNVNGLPATTVSGQNSGGHWIVDNANFELNAHTPPDGWTSDSDTTTTYETSTQYSGTRSLKLTQAGGDGLVSIKKVACRAGDIVAATVRAKAASGALAAFSVRFLDGAGSVVGNFGQFTASTSWEFLSGIGTAPTSTASADIVLYDANISGQFCYFDEVSARFVLNLDTEIVDGPTRSARTAAHSTYRPLSNPLTAVDSGSAMLGISAGQLTNSGLNAFTAANVVDGNLTNNAFHTDTAVAGAYMKIDLGAAYSADKLSIWKASTGTNNGSWSIECSDDGSSWTNLVSGLTFTNAAGEYPGRWSITTHQYWRILLENTPGSGTWLSEVQMFTHLSEIDIDAFTMRVAGIGDISLSSGTITGLAPTTLYYIYYDDPTYAGGAVTYIATTVKEEAFNDAGRFFVGSIRTPKIGGFNAAGNNDGGAGAQSGLSVLKFATSYGVLPGGSWSNLANAVDTDLETYAEATYNHGDMFIGIIVSSFSTTIQFPARGAVIGNVKTEVPTNTLDTATAPVLTVVGITWDGNTAWSQVLRSTTTWAPTIDKVEVPDYINPEVSFSLDGNAGSATSGSVAMRFYGCWLETGV